MHLWASLNAVGRNRRVPSFWQRLLLTVKTAYVPFFSPLGVPICIHVQRFFLTKENNKGHSFKLSCVSVLCKMVTQQVTIRY